MKKFSRRVRNRSISTRRTANAIVELIIAFQLLLVLSFGMVEFGQYFYIKHCFESAARDAARVGILATSTQSEVNTTLANTLAQANVPYNSSWLTMTDLGPGIVGIVTDISTVPAGDQVQFDLTTTYDQIPNAVRPLYSLTGKGIGNGKPVSGRCTMVKE